MKLRLHHLYYELEPHNDCRIKKKKETLKPTVETILIRRLPRIQAFQDTSQKLWNHKFTTTNVSPSINILHTKQSDNKQELANW